MRELRMYGSVRGAPGNGRPTEALANRLTALPGVIEAVVDGRTAYRKIDRLNFDASVLARLVGRPRKRHEPADHRG